MSKIIIAKSLPNILKQLNSLFICKCHLHSTICAYKDFDVLPSLDNKLTEDEHFTSLVSRPRLPIITSRKLEFLPKLPEPRQVWVESLDTIEEEKLGLIDLHPHIFGSVPRLDILHQNLIWQKKYRKVNYDKVKNRAEMRGGGRKPWPQKGTGRARHGSIRSPLFLGGGVCHGPRGYKSYFYMLPFYTRILGLRTALSIKLAQDDLHVVDSLNLPTEDSTFLEKLAEMRNWGISVLFIDDTDVMPQNITLASDNLPGYTLMPVYGLNVYSMLRHDTLVLTLAAVEKIEERLLYHMHKLDYETPKVKPASVHPTDAVNPELVKQMAAAYQRPQER